MGQLPFVIIDDCFSCMTNENKVTRLGKTLKSYENGTVVEKTVTGGCSYLPLNAMDGLSGLQFT